MKNIMKRAHEIRKEAAVKFNCKVSEIIFSLCLKMAWSEHKNGEKTMDINEIAKRIDEEIQAGDCADASGEYWYATHVNVWQKNGKNRIYVNMTYGRGNKWKRGVSRYLDLDSMTHHNCSRMYNNVNERNAVEKAIETVIGELKK